MCLIANENERGSLVRFHPELNVVEKARKYTGDHRKHVRWNFGEIYYLDAVLIRPWGQKFCDLLSEPNASDPVRESGFRQRAPPIGEIFCDLRRATQIGRAHV